MSIYKKVLEKAVERLNSGLSCEIVCGRLPDSGGIAAEICGGETVSEYIDGGAYIRMEIIFRAKSLDSEQAFATIGNIADYIRKSENLPDGISAWGVSSQPALEDGGGKGSVYRLTAYAEFYTL